jgi:hypothetical protein
MYALGTNPEGSWPLGGTSLTIEPAGSSVPPAKGNPKISEEPVLGHHHPLSVIAPATTATISNVQPTKIPTTSRSSARHTATWSRSVIAWPFAAPASALPSPRFVLRVPVPQSTKAGIAQSSAPGLQGFARPTAGLSQSTSRRRCPASSRASTSAPSGPPSSRKALISRARGISCQLMRLMNSASLSPPIRSPTGNFHLCIIACVSVLAAPPFEPSRR